MSLLLADLVRDRALAGGEVSARRVAREWGADTHLVEGLLLRLASTGVLEWRWAPAQADRPAVRVFRPARRKVNPAGPPASVGNSFRRIPTPPDGKRFT